MAAVKDRAQSGLSRPKTARFSDPQPLRSPPEARRHTVAGSKSHSAPTPSSRSRWSSGRIQAKDLTRRSIPIEPSLADRFADRLYDYRDRIQADVEKNLDEVQEEHTQQINQLSTQFQEQLVILGEAEKPLLASFAAERLRIPILDARSQNKDPEFKEIILQRRVSEHQKSLQAKHQAVNRLIEDWNKTQVEIITLAAEILGHEKVVVNTKGHPDLETAWKQSKASSKQAEDNFQDILDEISDLEQRAADLTAHTKETMHKQQKERKLITQSKMKEIKIITDQMAADYD